MPEPTTTTLALAVWPPASRRRHRYLADSAGRHPISPELAARAILAYSDPGDLVLDPSCAAGSVLVEAVRHGRRAIGISDNPRRAALAVANISHAREQGAPGRAAVLDGTPAKLARLLRRATAILDPNPARSDLRRHPAGSTHLVLAATLAGDLPELLPGLQTVLAPGGFLLLALEDDRAARTGLGATVAAAEEAGLHYWQHVIALRIPPEAKPSDKPVLLHTDVLVFRKPVPVRVSSSVRQAARA